MTNLLLLLYGLHSNILHCYWTDEPCSLGLNLKRDILWALGHSNHESTAVHNTNANKNLVHWVIIGLLQLLIIDSCRHALLKESSREILVQIIPYLIHSQIRLTKTQKITIQYEVLTRTISRSDTHLVLFLSSFMG